jgi:hypothetical protein
MDKPVDHTFDEYLRAIGSITKNHSQLELFVVWAISVVAKMEYAEALCFVGGENFDTLLAKLTRIFHFRVKDEALITEFESIHSSMKTLNEKRNDKIHSLWIASDDEQMIRLKFSKRFTKVPQWDEIPVPIHELEEMATGLEREGLRLMQFIHRNFMTATPDNNQNEECADK